MGRQVSASDLVCIGSKVMASLPGSVNFVYLWSCIRKGLLSTELPCLVFTTVVTSMLFVTNPNINDLIIIILK